RTSSRCFYFFFSSRRRHTRWPRDWSSDVCSSDLVVSPRHLNKHIDYSMVPSPAGVKDNSLAIPVGMAVTGDGATLYVTAFGSSKIGRASCRERVEIAEGAGGGKRRDSAE